MPTAPTVVARGAIIAATTGSVTPVLPAHVAGDWIIVIAMKRASTSTLLCTDTVLWMTGSAFIRGAVSMYNIYRTKAVNASTTAPTITQGVTAVDIYARAIVIRGIDPLAPDAFEASSQGTSAADPAVFTGITTLGPARLILALVIGEDNNNASTIVTATDPANFTESYVTTAVGADAACEMADGVRTTAGATGNVSVDWVTANPVGSGGYVVAIPPIPDVIPRPNYLASAHAVQPSVR